MNDIYRKFIAQKASNNFPEIELSEKCSTNDVNTKKPIGIIDQVPLQEKKSAKKNPLYKGSNYVTYEDNENNANISNTNNSSSGININEMILKKEITELLNIELYENNQHKYILDLSRYNRRVKKTFPDFLSFGMLDIDPKTNIKSYQNFNYIGLYNNYLIEVFKINI